MFLRLEPVGRRLSYCEGQRQVMAGRVAGCRFADAWRALFEAGAENILLSGSFDQARYVFRFARNLLGTKGYSYVGLHQQDRRSPQGY